MAAAYLWLNAVLYLVLALWCAARPGETAKALGYGELSAAGKTEFLTIYAGLELGLAAMYACLAWNELLRPMGLVFSVFLYGGMVAFRLFGLRRYRPDNGVIRALAVGEVAFLLIPLALLAALN